MRLFRHVVMFAVMLAFWLLLSGQFNALFIGMGVVAAVIATWFGAVLFESEIGSPKEHPRVNLLQLTSYAGWLLLRIIPSAIQVARIVLDPRLPPQPGMVRFHTELMSPAARTVLANSITLVPGTMTVDVEGAEFTVHSFTPDAVEDLSSARMQNRIAKVFRDAPQPEPEMVWESGARPDGSRQPSSAEPDESSGSTSPEPDVDPGPDGPRGGGA
jgi:multicomponent Na+:H+ antiporter subunit E